jgi:hypothetical protein
MDFGTFLFPPFTWLEFYTLLVDGRGGGGKGGSVVYKKKKMDRIVNRILGMIVQSDLCGSRLISYHPPPLPPLSNEVGGTPHACGSGRRSGATGVMLSGGDSLTASVPSYLPSSCLASLLLFISDKIEEYNFLVLVLTYKITTNRPTRSTFYSIENVTLPQAFISLFCMCVCVQFPPF